MTELIKLEKIIIVKKDKNKGICSLIFNAFSIKNIFIDLTNGVSPVKIPDYEGINIIEGDFISKCLRIVLEYFQFLNDQENGLYEFEKQVSFKAKKGSEI